jgi:aldose 1-epimerase
MIDCGIHACFRLDSKPSATMVRVFAIATVLGAAITGRPANAAATLEHAPYGTTQGGQAVDIFTMTNDHGLRVRFLSYGGVITEIDVPDRTGRLDNIVLDLRTLRDYQTLPGHYGAITGRYANRIGGARFALNGQTYHLIANNGASNDPPQTATASAAAPSRLPSPRSSAPTLVSGSS